jgi:hypothetical protein
MALAIGNIGRRREDATDGHADWGELVHAHDDRDVPCGLIHVNSVEALQRA